ncbi:capsule assembly Wzi family protein [Spirosoma flavum]|uniref:Capsule assembly Wzi family protein n=1 Tax=Spirosoma flavum TaxID=2048557 RepID=A0ABW6AMV4_9BACT
MRVLYLLTGLLLVGRSLSCAQPLSSAGALRYSVEIGGLATSSPQSPFWLRTNQYNTVPVRGSFGTTRLGIVRDYKPRSDSTIKHKSRLDWGFGLYAVANAGPKPTSDNPAVLLPDAYIKVRFKYLELYGGNRREVFGLGDTLLTSGFVAWSGNAMPFPKIQLHTPDFVPLGFTKKLLAFRAGYAHGWFINSYIQGGYLHQKYLYGRIGKPNWRVRFYGGLNHQVQWGGHADYLIGTPLAVNGHLSTSFQDYLALVIGIYPDALENARFTSFDGTNRLGNHVGSYDAALEWKGDKSNWLLYHQHMYDDASGLALQNVPDGLTGLRYLNHSIKNSRFRFQRVVLEWLSTTDQSGPTFDPTARYQGADNYFNHSQYIQGWSYRGRTIGTPFIMPRADLTPAIGNGFAGNGYYPNNRVVAWYLGAIGTFRRGPTVTTRLSYSRNFGSYKQPYPQVFHQLSTSLAAQWPINKWPGMLLTTSLALDRGELLPDSFGSYVSLKKVW